MSDPVYDKPNGAESVRSFFKRLDKLELGQKPGAATLSGDFLRAVCDLLAERDALVADMERVQLVPDAEHAYQQGLMARAEAAEAERDEARAKYEDFRSAYKSEREQLADENAEIAERERDAALSRVSVLRDLLEAFRDLDVDNGDTFKPEFVHKVLAALADPDKAAAERDERLRDEVEAHYVALLDGEFCDTSAAIARAIIGRDGRVGAEARAKAWAEAIDVVQMPNWSHTELIRELRALAANKPKETP